MTLDTFTLVTAVFRPRRTDDLKAGALGRVGSTAVFEALWPIEEGEPYAGEWAMGVPREWGSRDFVWVPSGDLADIKEIQQ